MIKEIPIKSMARTEFIDITDNVQNAINELNIKKGVCYLFVPHSTAGITINEGADPSVKKDIEEQLMKLVPFDGSYHHSEGNSAAHIKASLLGFSTFIFIEEGRLRLGTWQSIYFCEFDGPRNRRVSLKVIREE
ncbi:MAG: YjbQ family protein [Nitrospirae bacterium]|nr:YjbQ family protein [Nitrospirota bacterium]